MTRYERGATVGGYRIEGNLGEGGMGIVYRAVQLSLGREVALKVLNPGIASDPELRKRFIQEGVLAARVTHGRLVRVLEVGEHQGRLFLAYELVDGETLRQRLDREGPLAPEDAVELAVACADVLAALHRSGVLHRDLKPANIFVSPTRGPLVGDLGIAKDQLRGASVRTSHGILLGTPGYMAPEFLEGRPASAASDIYALGVVFFECLTGRRPYDAKDPLELLKLQSSAVPPDVCRLRPELGTDYRRLIEKALARNPAARPPSAEALKRELEALPPAQTGEPFASRASHTVRISSTALPRATEPIEATHISRLSTGPAVSMRPWAVALVLAAGVGAALMPRAPAPAPLPPPLPVAPAPVPDLQAKVAAAEAGIERAWKEAWKLQVHYENTPERIDPGRAAEEVGAIVRNAFNPVAQLLDAARQVPAAGRDEAARACGVTLCRLLSSAMRCRSSLWSIFTTYNEHGANKKVGGFIPDAAMPQFEYRYATVVTQTAQLLVANIPKEVRAFEHPVWHAGIACLHALCREGAKNPKAAKQAYDATVAAVDKAWDALVFADSPTEIDLDMVETLLQALDAAGAKPSRVGLIKRSRDRLASIPSRTPGQELMRHVLQMKSIEIDLPKDILAVNSEDAFKPRLPLYVVERDTLLRNWPYDPRQPPPANPTPRQAEATKMHAKAQEYVGRVRIHVREGAESAGTTIPPEPSR